MLLCYVHLLLFVYLVAPIGSGHVEQTVLRGVQTSLLSMYIPSKPFMCLDGSINIPYEFINDDYCDCRDGSDEPGTSACPNGRFFCENKGYVGNLIPSHHVGDGVCDCCDGSDEYEGRIACNNTCFELSQKTQAERDAQRALHEAGVAKKKEIIANAADLQSQRQTHLDELERSLENIENEFNEKQSIKQQTEALEIAAKNKHQKLWDEQRAHRDASDRNRRIRDTFADLDANQDSLISVDELQKHTELDTSQENEFTADEARAILGADTVNADAFSTSVFDQISASYQKQSESVATSLDHEKHTHDDTAPEYDHQTKQIIQVADQARNEFNDIEEKMTQIKHEIEESKKESGIDIGAHGEYAAFINECYDFDERDYTYRVCMFKDVKQVSKSGGSDVIIGYWDSWSGPSNNHYLNMNYNNGATCWNGPARSIVLTLKCALEHRIIDVREPSRCEYAMVFETPSACDETIATASPHSYHVEF